MGMTQERISVCVCVCVFVCVPTTSRHLISTLILFCVLALKNSTSHLVASYPGYLFLYGEWVNLAIVSSWHWVL